MQGSAVRLISPEDLDWAGPTFAPPVAAWVERFPEWPLLGPPKMYPARLRRRVSGVEALLLDACWPWRPSPRLRFSHSSDHQWCLLDSATVIN